MSILLTIERLEALRAKALTLNDSIGQEIAHTVAGIIAANWSGHSPAAAGDPPAVVTGQLAASVEVQPAEGGYSVGSHLPYAAELEYGTSRMAARPWLRPAVEATRLMIPAMVRRWWGS